MAVFAIILSTLNISLHFSKRQNATLLKCVSFYLQTSAPARAATQQPHFKGRKDSVLHFYCRHIC